MKYIRLLVLMLLLVTSVAWAGTGTFKTYDGSSQTSTGTWDLSIPGPTVGTDDLEDHSITGVKIATDTDIEAASVTLSDKVQAAWADILGDIYASGTVAVSAGTAAAPAYTFSSDPNTGIYSAGADTIGFSAGGNQAASVTSAGISAAKFITYTKLLTPISASSITQFTELGAVGATTHAGYLSVQNSSNGDTALIALANASTTFIAGSSQIGVTKDEVTNINVYVESGYVQIQNTYIGAANVRVVYWGAKY